MIAQYYWYTRVNAAGRAAAQARMPFWVNPHERESPKWFAWYDGWLAAKGLLYGG